MSINATLLAQMVVFALLVWVTMKFIWPLILGMLEERNQTIADGLAAAEKGQRDLLAADEKAAKIVREARAKALDIVDQAERRSSEIVDEARSTASAEGKRLVAAAQAEAARESEQAREALRKQVAAIALAGAGQVLGREVDAAANEDLLQKLAADL